MADIPGADQSTLSLLSAHAGKVVRSRVTATNSAGSATAWSAWSGVIQASGSYTADLIVYGATPGGLLAAYDASRKGKSVIVVGGWREKHIGGMMTGGLGGSDVSNDAAPTGMAKRVFELIFQNAGRTFDGTAWTFEPRYALTVFNTLMSERGIACHMLTGGIDSLSKVNGRIKTITTTEGKTYSGKYFVDASYEGDLLSMAGVSFTFGREASSTQDGSVGGNRLFLTTSGSDNHNFSTTRIVDPYVTPGVASSGLLPMVTDSTGQVQGGADARLQAYNFRMIVTSVSARRVAWATAEPRGYDPQRYEILFRYLAATTAAGGTLSWNNFWTRNNLFGASNVLDANNAGPFSSDFIGGNVGYITSGTSKPDYAAREVIQQNHVDWIRGWLWAITGQVDSRVPAALRSSFNSWGYEVNHFTDPYPGDPMYWPYALYVREGRRMQSDFILRGSDFVGSTATDGTTPRSTRTIAVAAYKLDSHHMQRLLWKDAGGVGIDGIWNEGNVEANSGGTDKITPIPYDVVIPKRGECTNLLVTFAISATHLAFGAFRMEFTHMEVGQAVGHAAAIAIDASEQDVQDVDYATLRASIQGIGDVYPATLPQVN